VSVTGPSGDDVARLEAGIARLQSELDRLRSRAAARSVVDLATGMLMEQLGCTLAEARRQLASLAGESGHSLTGLAAQITSLPEPAADAWPGTAAVNLAWADIHEAPDGTALTAALLEDALAPAGATAVALWLTEPDGGLELAGEAGFGELEASRWRRIHPDMPTIVRDAAAGTEIWWRSGRPAGYDGPLIGRWPDGALAALPLSRSGLPLGCMVVRWPEPLDNFPPPLRRQIAALADIAAQALGTGPPGGDQAARHRASWILGLLDAVLDGFWFLRPVRRPGHAEVTDLRIEHVSDGFRDPAGRFGTELAGRQLREVWPEAGLAGGLLDTCVKVLATGQPQDLRGDPATQPGPADGPSAAAVAPLYDGVAVAWRAEDDTGRLARLLQHAERLGRIGGWEENLRSGEVHWTGSTFALFGRQPGEPVPIARLHSLVHPDDVPAAVGFRDALLLERRESVAAFRVVRPDDSSVRQMRAYAEPVIDPAGGLIAVRGAYQDVSADYHTQLAFAAAREQLADSEQRAQEEHRLAVRLQQAITPLSSDPLAAVGLDVVARYRPSGPGHLVSGDWYDTVLLPTKQVLVVVGDIAGHGLDAVTGMVSIRNALRGLAMTEQGPAALLAWLNTAACQLNPGIIGTAVCGIYDPAERSLRWARAGHLPPVLVRSGQASALSLPEGLLLGGDPGSSYEEVTTSLRPGDVLLLFTDGLIERRDQPIDDAIASLLEIASQPLSDVSSYADQVVAETSANTDDDACLVAVHVR
jgi:serine phosphatase RsbU (regulator of sigma subunit)/PAS domain-containing protein